MTSSSIQFSPLKVKTSEKFSHSEQVDDIAQSIKLELQDSEFELAVGQLCKLLKLPDISQPPESLWPSQLFGDSNALTEEEYNQKETMRLLSHLWGAGSNGFESVGDTVFANVSRLQRNQISSCSKIQEYSAGKTLLLLVRSRSTNRQVTFRYTDTLASFTRIVLVDVTMLASWLLDVPSVCMSQMQLAF